MKSYINKRATLISACLVLFALWAGYGFGYQRGVRAEERKWWSSVIGRKRQPGVSRSTGRDSVQCFFYGKAEHDSQQGRQMNWRQRPIAGAYLDTTTNKVGETAIPRSPNPLPQPERFNTADWNKPQSRDERGESRGGLYTERNHR
jgi:hypothetical protein